MTELLLQPHVARLVVFFLLDQTEVTSLVGQRIYTDVPTNATYPLVRITQFPGGAGDHRFVGRTVIQVEAWGPGMGDRHAANRIAETCAATLARLSDRSEYGGETAVVTDVAAGTVGDDLDPDFTPAKPRSKFTAVVTATPAL